MKHEENIIEIKRNEKILEDLYRRGIKDLTPPILENCKINLNLIGHEVGNSSSAFSNSIVWKDKIFGDYELVLNKKPNDARKYSIYQIIKLNNNENYKTLKEAAVILLNKKNSLKTARWGYKFDMEVQDSKMAAETEKKIASLNILIDEILLRLDYFLTIETDSNLIEQIKLLKEKFDFAEKY